MSPPLTRDAVLTAFHSYGTPKKNWLIGGEYERAIVKPNGAPVSYDEPHGIQWFLEQFQQRWGWSPYIEEEKLIALHKEGASITLEPGGQFELSGAPHRDLSELEKEFELNRSCLQELAREANSVPITCGLTPVSAIEDVHWMPKGRYAIMRSYLPQKGDLALFMMKGTSSVQCNYDFLNEEDCAEKVQLCSGLAPLTTALFANSPLYQNEPTGFMSYRGEIWTRTDPDRTGFPPGLRKDYTHERWVDYLLDVPMMFIKRDQWLHAHGRSFRSFIESGIDGHFPTWDDWELHMTSVFPEVRIKRTIEVRGADCVPHELALGFCALFTGLLYDDQAQQKALELTDRFTFYGTRGERFQLACREGLRGLLSGTTKTDAQSLAWWAEQLIDIAQGGLERYQPHNRRLLEPLVSLVETGGSPAEQILASWQQSSNPTELINTLRY